MLSAAANTNLAQKHLGVLYKQWQVTDDVSLIVTLEMSFILMMNRALGSLLLEVATELAEKNLEHDKDFLSLIAQSSRLKIDDQSITQLSESLANPLHWLHQWRLSWQSMTTSPLNLNKVADQKLIATASGGSDNLGIEIWYHHFNELIVDLRAQNEYC